MVTSSWHFLPLIVVFLDSGLTYTQWLCYNWSDRWRPTVEQSCSSPAGQCESGHELGCEFLADKASDLPCTTQLVETADGDHVFSWLVRSPDQRWYCEPSVYWLNWVSPLLESAHYHICFWCGLNSKPLLYLYIFSLFSVYRSGYERQNGNVFSRCLQTESTTVHMWPSDGRPFHMKALVTACPYVDSSWDGTGGGILLDGWRQPIQACVR